MVATYPGICAEIDRALAKAGRGSASALAVAVGVAVNTVSGWRAGRFSPDQPLWPAIEKALKLPKGRLREAAGNPPIAGDDDTDRRLAALEREVERLANLYEERRATRRAQRPQR